MLKIVLWIGAGGFLGSISRYLLSQWIARCWLHEWPAATFAVNMLGCLLIGCLIGLFERFGMGGPEYRLFLTAGFCGSFTTFSTFTAESLSLLRSGQWFLFFGYIMLSLIAGIFFTWAGMRLAGVK